MEDTMLKNKIKNHLDKNPAVDSSDINIFVYKGEVTMVGTVRSKKEKIMAEFIVNRIDEVKRVFSKLELLSEAITLRLPPIESVFQRYSRAYASKTKGDDYSFAEH